MLASPTTLNLTPFLRSTPPEADVDRKSIALEETNPPWIYSQILIAVAVALAAAIVLACVSRIDILARAAGEVIPKGDVVAVQHLEGGIVSRVLVMEGETVREGQPLAHLAPLDTETTLAQLESQFAAASLSVERHQALLEEREPQFPRAQSAQAREQIALFREQRTLMNEQAQLAASQIEQQTKLVTGIEGQLAVAIDVQRTAAARLQRRQGLLERGIASRVDVEALQMEEAVRRREVAELRTDLAGAQAALNEAQIRSREALAVARQTLQEASVSFAQEARELEERIAEWRDRANRLTLRAPVDGVVHAVRSKAKNTIVQPGEPIIELVPTAEGMLASVRINPRDIAAVTVGQEVDLRVTAYDFTVFGSVKGEVVYISPTTLVSEDGFAYYRSYVSMDRTHFGDDATRNRILPGMTIDADVVTGSRTVMGYLLKPISRGWRTAMTER